MVVYKQKALHLADGSKQEDILLCAVFLQARLAFCKGDYALAAYSLNHLREDLERGGWYNLMHTMELCDAWIALHLGRKQAASPMDFGGRLFLQPNVFPRHGGVSYPLWPDASGVRGICKTAGKSGLLS